MKQFTEFTQEDQKLICEAMRINNEGALSAMQGIYIDNSEEFKNVIQNMGKEAKEYMIEILKSSLPEEYR